MTQTVRSLEERAPSPPTQPGRHPARALAMLLVGLVAFGLYLAANPRTLDPPHVVDSPRENIALETIRRAANGDGLRIRLRHHDLPPDISRALTPRDSARVSTDAVTVQDFAGVVVLFTALFWLWAPLALIATPLLAVLSAFLVAQLAAELFGQPGSASWRKPGSAREAWIGGSAFLLWLAYPGLVINGSLIIESGVVALTLLLYATIRFVRYWRGGATRDLIWFAVAVGAATAVRYPSLLFALPLLAALLASRRLNATRLALAGAAMTPFALLILGFNQAVYGSPTTTGHHLTATLLRETTTVARDGFLLVQPSAIRNHLWFYVIGLPMMLLPALVGGIIGAVRVARRRHLRVMIGALLASGGILVAAHIGFDTWGASRRAVNASLIRYTLPAIAIGLVFLCAALPWRRPRLAATIVGVLVVASVWTAYYGPVAIRGRASVIAHQQAMRALVFEHTPADALIAGRLSDRYLFPDRQTLTLTLLMTGDEPLATTADTVFWDLLPSPERFASVAAEIRGRDIDLYLIGDFSLATVNMYRWALARQGLGLEWIDKPPDPSPPLYRIA